MGFAELIVIAIVGLIVVGPDKLPQAIKSGMVWFGRIKRLLNETRSEFEQQLGVDEIRREIHNEQVMASLKALRIAKEKAEAEVLSAGEEVEKLVQEIREDFPPEDEGLYGEQHANHPPEANTASDNEHPAAPSPSNQLNEPHKP